MTFKTVEEAFWCIYSWKPCAAPWHVPLTSCHKGQGPSESPAAFPPYLLSGVLAQVAELQVRAGQQGERRAQGHMKGGEGALLGLCAPHTLLCPPPRPSLACSIRILGHLVQFLRPEQEAAL